MNDKLTRKQSILLFFYACFIIGLFTLFSEIVSNADEQEFYALEHGEKLTDLYNQWKLK